MAVGNGPCGIDLEGGNTAWTITGNSFYQTVTRTPTGSSGLYPILIENNTGTDYVVTGNYIGGTAANCGGTALTFDYAGQTQDNYFYGIILSVGGGTASYVQNNTVANIAFGSKCQAAAANTIEFAGILVAGGYVSVTNNTLGSATGNGSIAVSLSANSTQAYNFEGIFVTGTQGAVENNNVGSITVSGGKTNKLTSMRGLDCEGALVSDFSVSNNLIGSTTTANSIQYTGGTANEVAFDGMFLSTTGATYYTNVFNNTVQNIANTGTANPGVVGGIVGIYDLSTSLGSITTNTIANITTAVGTTQDMMGIYFANTTAGQTIANNYIHDLSNTYAGATATDIDGIYYAGPTTGANTISANAIYNLTLNSTNTGSNIYGLYVASGLATTSNNMITLGNSVTIGYAINGIYQNSATAANNYYFNSIYIGGAAAAAGSNTNAFFSKTATHTIENNIFYNARTQSAGAGNHYAIDVQTKAGVTSNYNDLLTSVAANLGSVNGGGAALTLANWQAAAPAGDANSISSNPSFVAPTAATANLHINAGSPVIAAGLNGTGITVDFDNNLRNNPPSIGADEEHTEYYSKSSGSLDVLATWGTNTDGSGTSPLNFTSNQCTYNIRNNAAPTLGVTNWVVSGTGSNIVLGDGTNACNLTVPAAYSCTGSMNISNNATLTAQNATLPTLSVLNSGSTVNYNSGNGVAQTVQAVTYGNLIISNSTGSGATTKTAAGNIYIAGNLTISSYATFDMTTYYANRTGGGGTLSVAANGTLRLSGTTSGASANNNFPNNFATMTLNATSTVEYYGATQTIYNIPTYGNLTNTTSGTKTAGGTLTIDGIFTINSPATFAASTFTHNFKGNFINNGTFTANTSTADFNGTVAQTISGTSTTTFHNFTLNNATGVTLSAPINVSTICTLTSGLLNTDLAGVNILTMQNASTFSPATFSSASTSYINGPMMYQLASITKTNLWFPVGSSPDCRPSKLLVQHTTFRNYNYTAQLFIGNAWVAFNSGSPYIPTNMPSTVDTISGVHYWTINRTDSTGATISSTNLNGNQTIELFFGVNDQVYQGSNLTIVKNTSASPAAWIDIGGTSALGNFSSGQAGNVTSTSSPSAFNSFSTFTLGSDNTGWNPLPIKLLNFTAVPDGEKVDVAWETVTEVNNDYFTVEKSKDGTNFTKVIDVRGAGNSTTLRNYAETDYQPYIGTSYYRLKQTDKNGVFTYSSIVLVNFNAQKNITVYPNPIDNKTSLNVQVFGFQNQEVVVVLRDAQGREFLSKVLVSVENNQVFIIDEMQSLAPGIYIVTASSNDKIYNSKLIVK